MSSESDSSESQESESDDSDSSQESESDNELFDRFQYLKKKDARRPFTHNSAEWREVRDLHRRLRTLSDACPALVGGPPTEYVRRGLPF